MADIYVNSEELKLIATGMKTKATSIMESYQNDASSAILMGSECLQISGLDTTTLLNSFNKIFTNLGTKINTLADFLSTTVANEYDSTTSAIANEFNNNFANEIAGILGISVGKGALSSGSSVATPWPKDVELDPGFSYPNKPSIGGDTLTPETSESVHEPVTLPNPGPKPGNTGSTNPGGSTTTPGGNLGKLDPDFGYPKVDNPSTGWTKPSTGDTNIPGTGGSISTPTPLPGNTTLTPGTNTDANIDPGMSYLRENNIPNMNIPSTQTNTSTGITTPSYGNDSVGGIDPDMSYPNYANMKNLIDSRIDDIKINPVKRPIYELPVQPKPKPEIMSTNNILR